MNKDFKYKNTVGIESTQPKDMPPEHGEIRGNSQRTRLDSFFLGLSPPNFHYDF